MTLFNVRIIEDNYGKVRYFFSSSSMTYRLKLLKVTYLQIISLPFILSKKQIREFRLTFEELPFFSLFRPPLENNNHSNDLSEPFVECLNLYLKGVLWEIVFPRENLNINCSKFKAICCNNNLIQSKL